MFSAIATRTRYISGAAVSDCLREYDALSPRERHSRYCRAIGRNVTNGSIRLLAAATLDFRSVSRKLTRGISLLVLRAPDCSQSGARESFASRFSLCSAVTPLHIETHLATLGASRCSRLCRSLLRGFRSPHRSLKPRTPRLRRSVSRPALLSVARVSLLTASPFASSRLSLSAPPAQASFNANDANNASNCTRSFAPSLIR